MPLLDQEVRALLEPVQILLSGIPKFDVVGGAALISGLSHRRLEEVTIEAPALHENGLFGVPKSSVEDPTSRMITDGESSNWFAKRLSKMELQNP